MLKFCSLYSGSSGNCLYIENIDTKILIDAGVSGKKITEALASLNVNVTDINAILVTHEHIDHSKSLHVLSKKYNIPIYSTEKTWTCLNNKNFSSYSHFEINNKFKIGSLEIEPFSIQHDAIDPCAFNIYYKDKKISIATDLGVVTEDIINNLKNSSFILLEANYDPELLKISSYPQSLKARIKGEYGHLSNDESATLISTLHSHGLKHVMLGHLSNENNVPALAEQTILDHLNNNNISLKVDVATRHHPTNLITII